MHISEKELFSTLHLLCKIKMFSLAKVSANKRKYHTPTTYRSQRRLFFTPDSASLQTPNTHADWHPVLPTQPPSPSADPQNTLRIDAADGNAYTLNSFIQEYGGSTASPPQEWEDAQEVTATIQCTPQTENFPPNKLASPERVLPWENAASKITKLFNIAPPKLKYPAGSRDEDTNKRFIKKMDHYLFRSYHVRSVLVGEREHPFQNYPRLQQYWNIMGYPDWKFDSATTFALLDTIKANQHMQFHKELYDLLWFGGVVSYGNIMREIYAILYDWVDDTDLPDLEGLCEENDGPNFRKAMMNGLRLVRIQHTQEIIARLYNKLDGTLLVMRPGGMAAFFAKLNRIRLDLKKKHEHVSESYLLHRTYQAVESKHDKLTRAIAEMRRVAGATGTPTSFDKAKDNLIDTFDFEVPASAKTEKPLSNVSVNLAGNQFGNSNSGKYNGKQRQKPSKKKAKRVFPKGSCANCPNATDHTTPYCYLTKRKNKGLPPGWKWCTTHKNSLHYDHACFRHAPNYPPVPKIMAQPENSSKALHGRVLKMLGLGDDPSNSVPQPKIVITPAVQQPPQLPPTAHRVPTNSASHGPPVNNIFGKIMTMSKPDRMLLAARLQKAGF